MYINKRKEARSETKRTKEKREYQLWKSSPNHLFHNKYSHRTNKTNRIYTKNNKVLKNISCKGSAILPKQLYILSNFIEIVKGVFMRIETIKCIIEMFICASLCFIMIKSNDIIIIVSALIISILLFIENVILKYYIK